MLRPFREMEDNRMTQLKPGLKLKSAVCDAEVMIIKAGSASALTCGGVSMLGAGETAEGATANEEHLGGCQVGKRYVTGDESLEVLCVKAGKGSLAVAGEPLLVKGAKKLPSTD
jgi:hypothetical protein